MTIIFSNLFYIVVLALLAVPLGKYIYKVMTGQKLLLSKIFAPIERAIYKVSGVKVDESMKPKKYLIAILLFSLFGLIFLFLIQLLQGVLMQNPQGFAGIDWMLAFNTAASFVSNTNWQAYSGEEQMSYLTQSVGLTVQNFVSAATGIAVLFVLIRGLVLKKRDTLGNFWVDMTRIVLYVLIPLSSVLAVILVSQGVVQTFMPYASAGVLGTGSSGLIPLGPAASQIAIKQLGTNGGGFFGVNSAFPLENPTAFSNFLQSISILLIPAALCITFGKAVKENRKLSLSATMAVGVGKNSRALLKDNRQGSSILITMFILFVISLVVVTVCELYLAPTFEGVSGLGNMEGKEVRNGIGASSLWGVATTAASNGSVNSMHDSFTAIGGMILMFLMQLGEIVFGGVGSGLYGMLAFVLLTVFIAGLMVGRTPEYVGKKVEAYDMKMVCLIILPPVLLTLIGTAGAVMVSYMPDMLTNSGAHGFAELLYAFSSMGNNNGSAFAGYAADNPYANIVGGIIMLVVRFVPIIATVLLAGNLSKKKTVAQSEGTLATSNATFVGLLIGVILIIGALSFLPALALGPIASHFGG